MKESQEERLLYHIVPSLFVALIRGIRLRCPITEAQGTGHSDCIKYIQVKDVRNRLYVKEY